MADQRVIAMGATGDAGAVFAALAQAYTVHADPAGTMHWTWLDTADWRLHRAGVALREERRGRHRDLVVDLPGRAVVTAPVSGVSWPARLDRVAASPVRDAVSEFVGVRALLPVAEVETRRILLRLMDAVGKTRVRVSVDQQRLLTPRKAALPLHIAVSALRGYDRDARRCAELLAEAMGAETTALSPTDAALSAAGRLPGAPDPDAGSVQGGDPAVRPAARALLADVQVVDQARDGALADLDTEFLHELRSAIRSTRALLGVAGHLLIGRSAVRVERDLGWLEEMTAPLRAVDLALLGLAPGEGTDPADPSAAGADVAADADPGALVAGLPGADLDALREQLRRRRRTELRRMRASLRAPRAPAAFTAWRRDLRAMVEADPIGPSAGEVAGPLAATAYRAVTGATDEALPGAVAALREVLAAFGPLYDGASAAGLGRDLDRLHELLRRRDGLRMLRDQVRAAAHAPALSVEAVLTAGALLERATRLESVLNARITEARAEVQHRRTERRVEGLTG